MMRVAVLVLLTILVSLTRDIVGSGSVSNDHPSKQKQYDEILIGYTSKSSSEDVPDLARLKSFKKIVNGKSSPFFKDLKVVDEVQKILNHKGFRKTGVFDLLDYEMRHQTIKLYELFSSVSDWRDLKNIINALNGKVHPEQLNYALATTTFHHFNNFRLAPPNWFEVYPNYLLPAATLRELYRRKMKGMKETVIYVNIANETVHGKNSYFNAFSDTDPESKLRYFRDDTGLSNMFINWHMHFPNWRPVGKIPKTQSWEDRGHLFYYFHQQLLSRYNLERINNKMEPVDGLSWDKVEMGRYVLDLLDNDGDPIPGRHAGAPNIQNTWWKRVNDLTGLQHRISQVVDSNLILTTSCYHLEELRKGSEIYQLGNTILGTGNSSHPEYYGSYFFEGTDAVNIMGKGDIADNKEPGFFFKMLTTLRDPIFYSMLENIRSFIQDYTNTYISNYKDLDEMYDYEGLSLDSVKINNELTTYFDYEEIDVTKVIDLAPNEKLEDIKYKAKILKLNHKPFSYTVKVTANNSYLKSNNTGEPPQVMFRLFLGPKHDWKGRLMDFQSAIHYFVEIDRFPINLKEGTTETTRNSKDSSIYVDGELNYAKVIEMMKSGKRTGKDWNLDYTKEISFCGLPSNLMLPKGEPHGNKFRIISLITPFKPEEQGEVIREFKSFPLCGNLKMMDHWTGFPFDRIGSIHDDYFKPPFALQQELTIFHTD
ncbi:hexamerin-like [Cimex lectularius]|uniref:Hexamerin n=1 Tax=Cimex lectularius TaxID=79782 RepID=A0A8I6SBP2_CIMLE|nr:hexamerin-like [Cimex lectularius]